MYLKLQMTVTFPVKRWQLEYYGATKPSVKSSIDGWQCPGFFTHWNTIVWTPLKP